MPSGAGHDQPNPPGTNGSPSKTGKHWLEYGIFAFAVLTALFTGLAAYYTKGQWQTALDTEIKQTQAIVVFSGLRLQSVGRKQGNDIVWAIIPEVENIGDLPTQHAVMWFGTQIGKPVRFLYPWFNRTEIESPAKKVLFEPKIANPILIHDIIGPELNALYTSADSPLFFFGRIEYGNGFGSGRITEFCVMVRPPPVDINNASADVRARWWPCDQHNCHDDECTKTIKAD